MSRPVNDELARAIVDNWGLKFGPPTEVSYATNGDSTEMAFVTAKWAMPNPRQKTPLVGPVTLQVWEHGANRGILPRFEAACDGYESGDSTAEGAVRRLISGMSVTLMWLQGGVRSW